MLISQYYPEYRFYFNTSSLRISIITIFSLQNRIQSRTNIITGGHLSLVCFRLEYLLLLKIYHEIDFLKGKTVVS